MTTTSPSPVQSLSRWIRYAAYLMAASVVGIYLVTWLFPEVTSHAHSHGVARIHLAGLPTTTFAALTPGERLLVASVSLPYLAAFVWAFLRLGRMLKSFERGSFFDRQAVGDLRAFAGLLLVAKILSLAAMHLRVAIVVHLLGHKPGQVLVNLSSDDLSILLLCALLFAIAHMMEEGRRLAEENREFV